MLDPRAELLEILDVPQLGLLAPELVPFRERALALKQELADGPCTSCAKRKLDRSLLALAIQLDDLVKQSPGLTGAVSTLRRAISAQKAAQ